jgi:glycosyltransferase involved in cell wall biosynthesis
MKILHIITGLHRGGAEIMLYKLQYGLRNSSFNQSVISFSCETSLSKDIRNLGVPVYSFDIKKDLSSCFKILPILFLIIKIRPNLIQGWMYHGNIVASISKIFLSNILVNWNVRQSLIDISKEKKFTKFIIKLSAFFSSTVDRIVYNSTFSAETHEDIGFNKNKTTIIYNGFDIEKFIPNSNKEDIRQHYGIDSDKFLVGMIARYHPMKDHTNMINAAIILLNRKTRNYHFMFVGEGVKNIIDEIPEKHQRNFSLVNAVLEVEKILPIFDINVLSSWNEGFPNVIGEAMACGIPCIATDVGESRYIIGQTGFVVPPKNPESLAEAIDRYFELENEEKNNLSKIARQRVVNTYSLDKICKEYDNLYRAK